MEEQVHAFHGQPSLMLQLSFKAAHSHCDVDSHFQLDLQLSYLHMYKIVILGHQQDRGTYTSTTFVYVKMCGPLPSVGNIKIFSFLSSPKQQLVIRTHKMCSGLRHYLEKH